MLDDDALAAVGNVEDVAVCPLRSQGFGGDTGIFLTGEDVGRQGTYVTHVTKGPVNSCSATGRMIFQSSD